MTRSAARRALVIAALVGVLLPALQANAQDPGNGKDPAPAPAPGQWISKSFTESLGRLPTQREWRSDVDWFGKRGCTAQRLASRARERYTSAEFLARPYDASARVLTAYRGLLNDEPDRAGFDRRVALLTGGTPWPVVLDDLIADPRFAQVAAKACGSNPSYYFGSSPALRLPIQGTGFPGGTGEELQRVLDSAPPGATVWLAQRAVVRLARPLVVPADVALATTGLPTPRSYAQQARLVRLPPAVAGGQPMVQVRPGGDLKSVWVDGGRGAYRNSSSSAQTVLVDGGIGSDITFNTLSNGAGPTALGTLTTGNCRQQVVRGNLVTLYSTDHFVDYGWSDGLTIGCEDSLVEDNEVVDATDVGIIVFTAAPARQRSVVRRNRVLQAGNSAYGGLAVTEGYQTGSTFSPDPDFTGTRFEDNLVWTSDRAHYEFGLVVGIRPWYGDDTYRGKGAAFVGNTTGTERVRAGIGIVVTQKDVVVTGNTITTQVVKTNPCPTAPVAAAVTAGWASGTIQPYQDLDVPGCLIGGSTNPAHQDRQGGPTTTDADPAGVPEPAMAGVVPEEVLQRPAAGEGPFLTPGADPGRRAVAGRIEVMDPLTSVTMTDFQNNGCAGPPPTQGLDGLVIPIEPGSSQLRVRLNGGTGSEVGVAYFWSATCAFLGSAEKYGASIDTEPPAGASWLVVHLANGAQANLVASWVPPSA